MDGVQKPEAIKCRASRTDVGGLESYLILPAKAWTILCKFERNKDQAILEHAAAKQRWLVESSVDKCARTGSERKEVRSLKRSEDIKSGSLKSPLALVSHLSRQKGTW